MTDIDDQVQHNDATPRSDVATTSQPASWMLFGTCFAACQQPPAPYAEPTSSWESRVTAFHTRHSIDSFTARDAVEFVSIPAVVDARERLGRHSLRSASSSTTTTRMPKAVATASVPVSQTQPTHLRMPASGEVDLGARRYVESRRSGDSGSGTLDSSRNSSAPSPEEQSSSSYYKLQDEGEQYVAGRNVRGLSFESEMGDPEQEVNIAGGVVAAVDHRSGSQLAAQRNSLNHVIDNQFEISSSSSAGSAFEAMTSIAGGVAVSQPAPPCTPRDHHRTTARQRTVRFSDAVPLHSVSGSSNRSTSSHPDGPKWELPLIVAEDDLVAIRTMNTTYQRSNSLLMLPSLGSPIHHRMPRKMTYHSPYIPAYDITMDTKVMVRMSTQEIIYAAKQRSAQVRPERSGVDELGFMTDNDDDIAVRTRMYAQAFRHKATKRELRWAAHLKRNPHLKKSRRLKTLVRKGVPNFFRQLVWSSCIGSKQLFEEQAAAYNRYKNADIPEAVQNQIALDIRRTFPQHVQFSACDESDTQSGPSRLSRVLHAVAACNTEVAYCQSMNFIAASLLLFMEEGLAFWTMMQILETRVEGKGMSLSSYYTPNLIGLRRDMLVLKWLLKIKAPHCSEVLEANQVELEWICSEWFLCLFASVLPSQVCFRLWDVMMYEGDKLLFRLSLAIFKYHEQQITQLANDFEKLLFFLKSMARNIVDHNGLMRMALKGLGTFSRKTVVELRGRAITQIEEEAARRRR